MSTESRPISFRLSGPQLSLLEEKASAAGESPGECARRLVIESLQGEENLELLRRQDQVAADLKGLRRDLGRALEVVLVNAFPAVDPAKVRSWISQSLGG